MWLLIVGCTPALNWRDVSVGAGGLQALFPCKPDRLARETKPGVPMTLLVCKADDLTFAVSVADIGALTDPAPVLAAMRQALVANVGGQEVLAAPGSASAPSVFVVRGRGSDGAAVEVRAKLFSRNNHVFQASVLALGSVPEEAATTFFDGLHGPLERVD